VRPIPSAINTRARVSSNQWKLRLDLRLLLCVALALAATLVAYQAPARGGVAIGWLGDRLFVAADAGAAAADSTRLYADELTGDAPQGRSRWTRGVAELAFPGLGRGNLNLVLTMQGWPTLPPGAPTDQPEVVVSVEGSEVARLRPDATWRDYPVVVPAQVRRNGDLTLRLATSHTFTNALAPDGSLIADPRPKGVRLAGLTIESDDHGLRRLLLPSQTSAALMALTAALLYLALRRLIGPGRAFVVTVLLVGLLALALAIARVWAAALLPAVARGSVLVLVLAYTPPLLRLYGRLLARYRRGHALAYGLLAATLGWIALLLLQRLWRGELWDRDAFWAEFPDSLLYLVFLAALIALLLLQRNQGLPLALAQLQRRLLGGWLTPTLLFVGGGLWLGYQALLLRDLPMIGHADYADNGVVARNLLAGRGYVVDYVTQFYRLYNGGADVTRPQETWPLLQPLFIAPFFAAFGPSAWAARLPNLVFNALLLLLIYRMGAQLWDRRVGLCAALLTLTNILFFNMTIYATSDLAFVAFVTGALYCLYCCVQAWHQGLGGWGWLTSSGLLTGLMLLQRPSAGVIAAGMGLWLLSMGLKINGFSPSRLRPLLLKGVAWGSIALALLAPYLVRNLQTFDGKLFYSTESHDAWVIDYTPDWDYIYNVYTPEPPLNGPGVPDRSWLLRWGFDRTLRKFEVQWERVRNLLLPVWENGALTLATKPEDRSDTLLHTMGGWLALLALPLALRRRARLLSLLLVAFGPYLVFLIYYWHIEERYLPLLIPWLALFGMGLLWATHDRLARLQGGRWAGLALALVVAVLAATVQPSRQQIAEKVRDEPVLWGPDLEAYQWLRTLPPDTVVMARGPWQLNFYSEQPALMIPNTSDVDELLYIASYYRARYLVVETRQNAGPYARAVLRQLTIDKENGEACRPTPPGEARPDGRLAVAYCSGFYTLENGNRYQTVVYALPEGTGIARGRP
jgi:hypothetical protein